MGQTRRGQRELDEELAALIIQYHQLHIDILGAGGAPATRPAAIRDVRSAETFIVIVDCCRFDRRSSWKRLIAS